MLHFPNCGFNWFYEKFLSIGHFPDNWLGHTAIEPLLPFMIESRGAVTHGNIHDATRLYQERVMHQGGLPGSLAELLDAGILMRIERPILTLL